MRFMDANGISHGPAVDSNGANKVVSGDMNVYGTS